MSLSPIQRHYSTIPIHFDLYPARRAGAQKYLCGLLALQEFAIVRTHLLDQTPAIIGNRHEWSKYPYFEDASAAMG